MAARKIGALLSCGAAVTVVAPEAHVAIGLLAQEGAFTDLEGPPLTVHLRPYRSGEAADYRLVVTATGDPDVDGLGLPRGRRGRGVGEQCRRSRPLHRRPAGGDPGRSGHRGRLHRRERARLWPPGCGGGSPRPWVPASVPWPFSSARPGSRFTPGGRAPRPSTGRAFSTAPSPISWGGASSRRPA